MMADALGVGVGVDVGLTVGVGVGVREAAVGDMVTDGSGLASEYVTFLTVL